jgi:hypothetical protein
MTTPVNGSARHAHHFPPCYVATVGAHPVESAAALAELLAVLEDVFEPGLGENLAIWEGNRLLFVWTAEGKRLSLGPPA